LNEADFLNPEGFRHIPRILHADRHHQLLNSVMTETGGGFITSPPQSAPESPFVPPTPASTETTLASPPQARTKTNRPITAREEALLISNLDDQLTTITSRFTRRSSPFLL